MKLGFNQSATLNLRSVSLLHIGRASRSFGGLALLMLACKDPSCPQAVSSPHKPSEAIAGSPKTKTPEEKPLDAAFFRPFDRGLVGSDVEPDPSSPVRVDLIPYCEAEKSTATSSATTSDMRWLGSSTNYYLALDALLREDAAFVGVVPEARRGLLVVLMEPTFKGWAELQKRIRPSSKPVELRPACHTEQQRTSAEGVLAHLQQDPQIGSALHAWAPDASIGGFRVFVLPGNEVTATKIEERLGSIANVWFSQPFGEH